MGFIIDYLREKFPLNRTVIYITGVVTVFVTPLAGGVAAWLAEHAPLVAEQVGSKQLTAIFVTGSVSFAAFVITALYKFLDGWQKHEARIHAAATQISAPGGNPDGAPRLDEPSDDLKRSLADKPEQAHRAQDRGVGRVDEGEEFPAGQGG